MAIEYTRILSDEQVAQGTPNAQPSVIIASSHKRLVKLKCPSQGRLTDVDVWQTAGTSVAFKVTFIKSKTPFTPDTDIANATPPAVDLESLEIAPPISPLAGTHASLQEENIGYAYRNIDGGWTNNQRFIYCLIEPTAAGTSTTWNIFATVESDVQ